MKQLMRMMLAVLLVVAVTVPAFAAPVGFVDSIEEKPAPGLLPLGEDEHGTVYGWLLDANGDKVQCLHEGQIIVTPLHKLDSMHDILPASVINLMWQVYRELHADDDILEDVDGLVERMKEELGKHAETEHLSIYELFDVSMLDGHGNVVDFPDGYSLMVKFDVQIAVDAFLEVMSYAEDHWQLATVVENQGDGVLVVFGHLCPVAFLVEADDVPPVEDPDADKEDDKEDGEGEGEGGSGSGDSDDPSGGIGAEDGDDAHGSGQAPKTGDEANPALWGGLCAAALAGLLALMKTRRNM